MRDTNQAGRLRLVALVASLAKVAKPLLNLDQMLDLAKKGEFRLYARIPPGKVAYVDELLPIVTHRRSSVYRADGSWHLSVYSPQSAQIRPEVSHVALDPDQAEDLRARRRTDEMVFASGLSAHPENTLGQAGWWVPSQFSTSLVICPILPAPPSDAGKSRQRTRRISLKVVPEDVYVDERVIALLEEKSASLDDDPHYLRNRAPGVYALYQAAKRYHVAFKRKQLSFEEVQAQLVDQLPELGRTKALQVAKLLNPRYRRNSGIPAAHQKQLDVGVLNMPYFLATYRRESFINDALALVFYATDRWLDRCARYDNNLERKRPTRMDVHDDLDRLGFYQKERDALASLVLLVRPTERT